MASAFPTLSPTASTIRKTFFDTTNIGILSANAVFAVYPVMERKGRARNFYVSIHMTMFEVHKTQKDARNKKSPKYLVDFGDVFNVSLQNEPVQIKDDCICIMDPSNSLFFRPTDSEYDLQAWFDWILERTRECRSTKLLRPVFHEEFFEAAWDVQIVCKPKLRRDYSKKLQPEIKNDDLAEKRPQLLGHRRLCVCQSSFLLFTLGCRPSTNVDAPFDKNTFIDLSVFYFYVAFTFNLKLNVISNYGTQEKFFFIRIGRCSEIGSGELWMTTEHGASARSIHERISQINQRESERRRAQGIKINLPTISSSVLKSRAHRERSQTQNTKKLSNLALSKQQESEKIDEARKVSSNSTKDGGFSATKQQTNNQIGQPDSRSCLVDSFSCLQSIPEKSLLSEASEHQQNISSKKNSIVGLFTLRLGAKMSTGSSGKPADNDTNKLKAPHIPKEDNMKCDNTSLSNVPIQSSTQSCHRNSIVSSVFGVNKTRRNSLTNSSNNLQTISVHHQKVPMTSSSSVFSTQPSYDCAEDYMTYDPDEQHSQCGGHSLKLGSVGSRVSTCALTRAESRKSTSSVSGLSSFRQQALSNCSFGFHNDLYTLAKGSQSYVGSEYLEMNIEQKPLKSTANAQSYISNHSEGCVPHSANQTSISVTHPQAHSPGSSATSLSINADSGLGRMEQNSGSSVKLSQLLHPSASSSPPNYLKKTVGQKTKSIKNNEFDAFSTPNETLKNTEYAISDDKQQLCINSNNLLADVRKRAHSVGSKTWIKPSLKKFPIPFTNKKCNEATDLRDSEHVDSRRNTFEAKSTCSASSSFYPNSTDDHVEIDFDRDESQSIDSIPSLHSRHSSVSVHCSMGIRYTIDFLPSSHRGVGHCNNLEIKEGNDKKSLEKICLQKNCLRDCGQIRRKRSVPEMFQQQNDSNNTPTQQRKGQQQIMLESDQQQCTYCNNRHNSIANDHSLALRCLRSSAEKRGCISTNLSNVSQTKRSPPRAISSLSSSQLPTSQSMGSSSGISSRSNTESSTSALIERETRNNKIPELPIAEDDNDDYVMLNPIKSQRSATNPQQLTVRSICTILESSPSPSSSLSSDGDSRNRAGKLSTKSRAVSEVPSIPLDDCAILMLARRNTRATGHSPVRGIIANDSPVRARLSVSSRSRSPSLSPHQPIGKFSSSTTPQTYSTACSYFPSLQQRGSPSPTRRKISSSSFSPQEQRIIFMDPPNDKVQRKFTCPNLSSRSQPLHSSQKSINKESEDCNYAFISGQEI